MKLLLLALLTLPLVASRAAEPQPLMTTPGKVLLSEDFSGPSLPKTWDAHLHAECFSVVRRRRHDASCETESFPETCPRMVNVVELPP